MKHFLLTIFCAFSFFLASQAQSLVVLNTDTTEFPTLKVVLQVNDKVPPLETDFKILDEDKKNLAFSLRTETDSAKVSARYIFFLIEASPATGERALDNFKKSVQRAIEGIKENDKINVGFFGTGESSENDSKTLNLISTEFSSNITSLKSEIERRIIAPEDSINTADIYKSIYEALEFLADQKDAGQKILVVLSSAALNNNSAYQTDDVIEKAQRLNIPVYTVNFKTSNKFKPDNFKLISDKTGAEANTAKTAFEIRNAIDGFLQKTAIAESEFVNNYIITFITEQQGDGNIHQYEIQYKNETQVVNYTAPQKKGGGFSLFGNYGIIILIIMGLLGGYALWQYRIHLQQKALEQEELEEQEALEKEEEDMRKQELAEKNARLQDKIKDLEDEMEKLAESQREMAKQQQPIIMPQQPQKYDLKKTVIAGGGAAPVLMVSVGSFSQNFSLNKPTMTIGRNPNNDILIPDQTVSGSHAKITIENGSFFLSDLGSTNGTFVNGTRVTNAMLKSGDLIKLGAANCKFQIV